MESRVGSRRREEARKRSKNSFRNRRTRRDTRLGAPSRPVGAARWPRRRRRLPCATTRTRPPTFSGGVSAGPDRVSRRPRRVRRFERALMRDARRAFWSDGGRGERAGGGRRGASTPRRAERRRRKRRRRPPSRGDYARGERTRPTGKNEANRRPRASASRLGTSRTRMKTKTRGSSSSWKKTTSRRGSPSSWKKTTSRRRRSCSIRALPARGLSATRDQPELTPPCRFAWTPTRTPSNPGWCFASTSWTTGPSTSRST